MAHSHKPDVDLAVAGDLHHGRLVFANLFDVAGKKGGGLVNGGVFVVSHDDLTHTIARGKCDAARGGGVRLYPRPTDGAGPGSILRETG